MGWIMKKSLESKVLCGVVHLFRISSCLWTSMSRFQLNRINGTIIIEGMTTDDAEALFIPSLTSIFIALF